LLDNYRQRERAASGSFRVGDATLKSVSTFTTRYAALARTTPSVGLPFGLMVYSHAAAGWIFATGAIAAVLVALNVLRLAWGDQVTIAGTSLTVSRRGIPIKSVTSEQISAAMVNPKTLLVTWMEAGKRRSIILPQESFSADSFKRLTDAFLAFVPSDKLKIRGA
jgi:hypothetical protein